MNKKRALPLLLLSLLLCCALLAGCQSSAVKTVNDLTSQLDVTDPDRDLVEQIREGYEALSPEEKEKIENLDILAEAEERLAALDMDAMIQGLGNITLDSADAVAAARAAYDQLDPQIRQYVTGLDVLTAAEDTIRSLELDQAAEALDAMIGQIGDVTLDSADLIAAARDAVNAAPEEVRSRLSSLDTLIDAEQLYGILRNQALADDVSQAIGELGKVTLDSQEAIQAIREQYDRLPASVQELVGNYDVLTAAETALLGLQDKAAADEIKAMSAKDPAGAIEYAENYIGSRDLSEIQGDVVKNCIHAYVLLSQQYIKENRYMDAESLLIGCQEKYAGHAAVSEADKALSALYKKMTDPANGKIFNAAARGGYCKVTINNKGDAVFLKIFNISNPSDCVTVFVRANSKASFNLKDGTYGIHMAEGDRWYNEVELFGASTRYTNVNTTFSLETSRSGSRIYYQIYTLTLHTTGGTIGSSSISGDGF